MKSKNQKNKVSYKLIKVIGDTYYVKLSGVKVLVEMSKSYYLWFVKNLQGPQPMLAI